MSNGTGLIMKEVQDLRTKHDQLGFETVFSGPKQNNDELRMWFLFDVVLRMKGALRHYKFGDVLIVKDVIDEEKLTFACSSACTLYELVPRFDGMAIGCQILRCQRNFFVFDTTCSYMEQLEESFCSMFDIKKPNGFSGYIFLQAMKTSSLATMSNITGLLTWDGERQRLILPQKLMPILFVIDKMSDIKRKAGVVSNGNDHSYKKHKSIKSS